MKHERFLKGVAVITLGGLLAKGIGALYRIPLSNLLGGYGAGLYQMAYPFFCVLLTFSSAGIPAAFSRIVARERALGRETAGTVRAALGLFAGIGAAGTLVMCLFAPLLSALQGEAALQRCYLALAPSVLLVALVSVFRGYFQGCSEMAPTAVSELCEQGVKAGLGLTLALHFGGEPARAVPAALLAVTLSELAALLCLALRYRGEPRPRFLPVRRPACGGILRAALPVMAAASLLPLSQMADSVLLVRLLSRHTAEAVSLYGLFAGGAASLINLPAAVCGGLAAAAVPAVSEAFARGDEEEGRRRALLALALTLALSLPCAAGFLFFARPVVALLYPALSAESASTLARLLRMLSVSAALLAAVGTLASCLAGMGRAKYAAASMLAAIAVKTALQWALVGSPVYSVGGAAIAADACYLVAFFLDLVYTVRKRTEGRAGYDHGHRTWNGARRRHAAGDRSNASGGGGAPAQRHVCRGGRS